MGIWNQIKKSWHLQTAIAVALAIGALSWLFGVSLNPFVSQTGIALILNGSVNFLGQAPWIILGAFLVTFSVALLGIAFRRKRRDKLKWGELIALFFISVILPMVWLALLYIPGMLAVVLFLLGWGFGYLELFLIVWLISKTLGD